MNRRGFLKASAGALSATLGVFAVRKGVGQPEMAEGGAPGQQVDATVSLMSLATQGEAHYAAPVGGIARTIVAGPFPDPDRYVDIEFDEAGNATVVPPGMATPNRLGYWWPIERELFPEYDPAHGIVDITGYESYAAMPGTEVLAMRTAYAVAVAKRSATSLFRDTLTQSAPWTTEQMAKVRDEYRARPDVFRAFVASAPREGDAYAVRVIYEVGGVTP